MKTGLRTLVFFALFGVSAGKLQAQCNVSNFIIQNENPASVQSPGTCDMTFDMTFNIESNNGNKYIFIHQWVKSQYPDYFQCVNGHPGQNGAIQSPTASNLANAFLNIGINNSGATPVILTTYTPDNTVTMTTVASITKIVLPDGSSNFTLKGVKVTLPVSCGTPVEIIADFWSSQASNASIAQCVNCGVLFAQNYMTANGFVNCSNLTYSATLTNNTSTALNGFYKVYADVNGDGYFTPTTDTLLSGPINYSIPAGVGSTSNVSGSVPGVNLNQNVFLVFTQTTGGASGAMRVIRLFSTQCGTLSVQFSSFTAKRTNGSGVLLMWETASENNNSGFALQRNMENNNWQTIAFVNSQASGGNSNTPIMYTYNDLNAGKDIMQYRIRQVDIDGKYKFSEIRTVRGEGKQSKTIVYPNPSVDGRVNVVFEDKEGVRNVTLTDISGRIIREWKITNGNTIQLNNMQPGVYNMRIVLETGKQTFEKIVVINR